MDEQSIDSEATATMALAVELRVVLGRLTRRLREHAYAGDFTASQKAVLIHLEREGSTTVSALARAEGVRSQSMGATIATLEAAGLVSGIPDPTDGRQTILSLTDYCREMIKANRAAREDWLFRTIQTKFTSEEQQELSTAVELLKRFVD